MESNQQNQRILVKFNTYYDSVTLLAVSQRLQSMRGVEAALVAMATPLNLAVLESLEFASNVQAGSNDLLLAVRGSDVLSVENALGEIIINASDHCRAQPAQCKMLNQQKCRYRTASGVL